MDNITCYIIKSGVYYIQEHKMSGYTKTKEINGRCFFMSREFAEKLIDHLQEKNQEVFKNLKIQEYTLVKGKVKEATQKTTGRRGRPKKQSNLEMLTAKLESLGFEMEAYDNLEVFEVATTKEANKVIDNIQDQDVKISFISGGIEYVAEITINDLGIEIYIIDKETYIEDFGEAGIL